MSKASRSPRSASASLCQGKRASLIGGRLSREQTQDVVQPRIRGEAVIDDLIPDPVLPLSDEVTHLLLKLRRLTLQEFLGIHPKVHLTRTMQRSVARGIRVSGTPRETRICDGWRMRCHKRHANDNSHSKCLRTSGRGINITYE
jgi:hypothetical protein